MGGFDWIVAAIFLISILVGIFRGFVKEALSLTSWVVSIWLAFTFCAEAGEFINQYIHIPTPRFREWAGFALVFIASLFIFALLSYAVTKLFVRGPIKGVDRVLGLGFGAIRAAAIVVALLVVARGFGMETSDWWQNSKHLNKFEPFMDYVEGLFPEKWQSQSDSQKDINKAILDKAIEGAVEPEVPEVEGETE